MHETLCFSIQSPSPNLDDLPLRCDGCETVSCVVGYVRIIPDLPKDPSKIIQPLQEKSTLKKRLLFHAKKDCYFTQKKTLIFIKKRLLFFQAKHHHVYVCCMLKEKLDIM